VSLQKLEHVQPDALPRQATLWKGVGTYWHQLGTAPAEPEVLPSEGAAAALQPQHSGLFDHETVGVSWQKLEHVQPDVLPRQATLWYSDGTYWHQLGTALAEPEALPSGGTTCAASQPQHSGLFDHEAAGVSLQKLEHVQPGALPRQATLWKGVGTYWHQLGNALAEPEALPSGGNEGAA